MQQFCGWVCLGGDDWSETYDNCPEGQHCLPPTHRGKIDDTTTTPCTSDAPQPGRPKRRSKGKGI